MAIRHQLTRQTTALLAVLAGLLSSGSALAEVYKCTAFDASTQKSTITYSDAPCARSAKQTVTDIPASAATGLDTTPTETDLLVKQAILNGNLDQARALATTNAHWQSIALAEDRAKLSRAQTADVAPAAPIVDNARADCVRAQQAYDYVVRNQWRDRELVAAKKSIMQAACGVGVADVPASQPVVSEPYAGIRHTREILFPYGYGYGQVGPGRLYRPHEGKPGNGHGGGNHPGMSGNGPQPGPTNRGGVSAGRYGVNTDALGRQ